MLRATFSGFNMSMLALMASQRALDVTGQNLSNVNTAGYTRQRLDLSSISPAGHSIANSPYDAKVGQGVRMDGVSQIRDPFLDNQYRNQLAKMGTADATTSILQEIRNVFDETDKEAVRVQLSDIVSQLDNLAHTESAGTSSADALVRSACEVLLNTIHQNASDMEDVRGDLLEKLETSVIPDIDGLLRDIKELNQSIKNTQVLGNPALELQDQRNELIDELATYLPIEVSYKELNLGAGIKVDTLQVAVPVTVNGQKKKLSLIDDTDIGSIDVKRNGDGSIQEPVQLFLKEATDTSAGSTVDTGVDITEGFDNGVLRGDIDMLNKSEVFDGTDIRGIGYYESSFDMWVNEFAKKMNELNVDADGNKHDLFTTSDGSDKFTASNIKVSDEWMKGEVKITLSTEENAGSTAYDNVLRMMKYLQSDRIEYTASGDSARAIYTSELKITPGDTTGLNSIDVQVGTDMYSIDIKNDGSGDLTSKEATDPEKVAAAIAKKLNDNTNQDYTITAEGTTLVFTAKSTGEVGQKGPAAAPVSYSITQNYIPAPPVNSLVIISNPSVDEKAKGEDSVFVGTMFECYDNIQTTLGIEEKAYKAIYQNHETVLNQIADSKDSVSSVSVDEEVMNLMRFSQSYNAASRVMTTMDEILDKLINGTGVVGR